MPRGSIRSRDRKIRKVLSKEIFYPNKKTDKKKDNRHRLKTSNIKADTAKRKENIAHRTHNLERKKKIEQEKKG